MRFDKAYYDWMNEVTNNQRRILNFLHVLYDQGLELRATCDLILEKVTDGMSMEDRENLKSQLKSIIESLRKSNPNPFMDTFSGPKESK